MVLSNFLQPKGRPLPQRWCFPGTHNKWIEAGPEITHFSTSMVGEFFDLAQGHSLPRPIVNNAGFQRKLEKQRG